MASPPAPAIWYFDIISPFAYLAFHRLDEIREHRPVVLKPVVFAGFLKHWGQLGPAEIAPKRLQIYRQCIFLAEKAGLPFHMPPHHPFSPLAGLRLLIALGVKPAAVARAFHAVWGEGRDANDASVLAEIAAAGGDPSAIDRIGDAEVKAQLTANGAEALAAGIFGVPTLRLDSELFWGYDAVDIALAYCKDPGLLSRGEMARAAAMPMGTERRK